METHEKFGIAGFGCLMAMSAFAEFPKAGCAVGLLGIISFSIALFLIGRKKK